MVHGAAHEDQRDGISAATHRFQLFHERIGAREVVVDDDRVNLRLREFAAGFFRFRLDIHPDLHTAQDAFQNANFLPIAGYDHRFKRHNRIVVCEVTGT